MKKGETLRNLSEFENPIAHNTEFSQEQFIIYELSMTELKNCVIKWMQNFNTVIEMQQWKFYGECIINLLLIF